MSLKEWKENFAVVALLTGEWIIPFIAAVLGLDYFGVVTLSKVHDLLKPGLFLYLTINGTGASIMVVARQFAMRRIGRNCPWCGLLLKVEERFMCPTCGPIERPKLDGSKEDQTKAP